MKKIKDNFLYTRNHIFKHKSLNDLSQKDTFLFLQKLKKSKFSVNSYNKIYNRPLIQPRGGFSNIEKQTKLSLSLESAGADFIPLTIDSFTRLNDYKNADILIKRGKNENIELLNGYPLVNHGYKKTRNMLNLLKVPISLRHGTPDARLLVEHALASGITDIEGGGLSYCLPYSSKISVEKSLYYWEYVDELCAQMSSSNKEIMRESFGVLTATLVPPLTIVIVQILELLLSAQKGVQAFMLTFAQTGSIVQDFVISNVLRTLSSFFLSKLNLKLKYLKIGYHHWMGPFPNEFDKSSSLIIQGSINAALINADKVIIKTKHESHSIPTIEANCEAVSNVKYILDRFSLTNILWNDQINIESKNLYNQAKYVLNMILNNRDKISIIEVSDAVNKGWIDVPFSPHPQNFNKTRTFRDINGLVRIKDFGNIPLNDKLLKEEEKIIKLFSNKKLSSTHNLINDINYMVNN